MPRTNRPLTILFFACCSLCLHPGCLIIPQEHRNIERAGKKVEATQLSFVVPGQTTKAEFIDQVGQPYLMMDEWGVMAYYWKMLTAYVPWALPGGGGIGETDYQYLLLVSYDDQGFISNYQTIRIESKGAEFFTKQEGTPFFESKTVNEHALRWAGKGADLGKFTPVDLPAGKAVVYVYYSFDLGGMLEHRLDGVFLDGDLWAELQWGQYAPIVVSPGTHTIGFEPRIRKTDKFLHPHRLKPAPSLTTTIETSPNQSYFLEICFVWRYNEKAPVFSRLSENVAVPKMAHLKRAR